MHGMTENLTTGERVAWYRRRRGVSQEALAGLVGRTADWLGKAENNRIELDRLSVLRSLADALDVTLGDLIGYPRLLDWTADSGTSTVPALRSMLMDYRQLTSVLGLPVDEHEAVPLDDLQTDLLAVFDAYQASRFGFAAGRAPLLLADALSAVRQTADAQKRRANELLALSYQAAASVLVKLGEADLAWMAAERGLSAAQESENVAVVGSLFRAVAFALLATGKLEPAMQLTEAGATYLRPSLTQENAVLHSVYGTLFLAGSMAASRFDDRDTTRRFLQEAAASAELVGEANHLWTSFGFTNVEIHRMNTATELGDIQLALEIGPRIDSSGLPAERRVRHLLDMARVFNVTGRQERALDLVLDAERIAPEHVQHHWLSRNLALSWVRNTHGKPSVELSGLANRLHILGH